jgi:hypothetical protein
VSQCRTATSGLYAEIVKASGPDSYAAQLAGTILRGTETTLYELVVYFGSVAIRRGLLAAAAGVAASLVICRLMFRYKVSLPCHQTGMVACTVMRHVVMGLLSLSAAFAGNQISPNRSIGSTTSGIEATAWRQFLADSAKGKHSGIPDFSYSGYKHGEVAVPEIAGPMFNVTDYGARPDAPTNSAPAIQRAIDACEAAGGGVVLFPNGVFLINDNQEATASALRISGSRVVLRGAGIGADGTVLYSSSVIQPEDPSKMYTGRPPLMIGAPPAKPLKKASVKAPANKGSFMLSLEEGHHFQAGDRLVLTMSRKGTNAASFVDPHAWETNWIRGIKINELHEVASVEGSKIRLAEPLMIDVDAGRDWRVEEIHLLKEIGIENICFRGAWKEKFVHHRSWQDDSGWRGLVMNGCEDSWIRNCVFEDMNWAIEIKESRQITVEDVRFTGTPSHFGILAKGTYGVLGLRVRDEAGHHHGPSVEGGACSTVYHECTWGADTSFDSHAATPYATLHDDNEGGLCLTGVGGNRRNFPHHLHDLILWNLHVPKTPPTPVIFWSVGKQSSPKTFVQVLLEGLHGAHVAIEDQPKVTNEAQGETVFPHSLWFAQLEYRLGHSPAFYGKAGSDMNQSISK